MITTTTSQDLMLSVARGDRVAFNEVYERFQGLVRSAAMRVLGPGQDVDDVCQEVFISLWRDAKLYDPTRGSPSTWIGLLARRRAVDSLRSKIQRKMKVGAFDETWQDIPDDRMSDHCELAEAKARARDVISRLPDDQRAAVTLTVMSGLKGRQVAAIQRVPSATVKTRVRRGVMRMRCMLEQDAA